MTKEQKKEEVPVDEVEVPVERDLTKERNERCNPVASKIIKMIADADIDPNIDGSEEMGGHEAFIETYKPVVVDIIQLLYDNDLTISDSGYILSVVDYIYQSVSRLLNESNTKNFENAEDKLWSKEVGKKTGEITFADIDKVLKQK